MARTGRLLLLLVTAVATVALCAAPAQAAKRKVPFGFFGTVLSPELTDPAQVSDVALDDQLGLMARSGVESVRAYFPWAAMEPRPGVYDWRVGDRLVAGAARRRLALTANVLVTPPAIVCGVHCVPSQ